MLDLPLVVGGDVAAPHLVAGVSVGAFDLDEGLLVVGQAVERGDHPVVEFALDNGGAHGFMTLGVPIPDDGLKFLTSAHLGRAVGLLAYELLLHELGWRQVGALP